MTLHHPLYQATGTFPPGALLFDMDGLMVDSEPLWFQVEGDFARSRGGHWTEAMARTCTGQGTAKTLGFMSETFGFPVEVERDKAGIVEAFIGRVGELVLKPGCVELLAEARGKVPLALASSSPMRLIEAVLRRFDLAPLFSAVVSGESVTSPKPAPDIFLRTAERLGVGAERCVVLEDSFAGATAGHAAGMFVIAVPEGSHEGRGFEAVAHVIAPDLFAARKHLTL